MKLLSVVARILFDLSWRAVSLSSALCALCGCLNADEPLFETQRLFELTPKNKPSYRIPSIIQAPNGAILVICERRNDGPGDIGNHDI